MPTAPPIIVPEYQFSDADGHPYAGGTLETYIPGTSTPKICWIDPDQAAAQTNPVILDAAGRALLYGDGDYRLVLRDAAGNLIWDIEGTTLVSAAMAPVIAAPTIADALELLGIHGSVDDETAARIAADDTERAARIAADIAEANARATNVTDLQTALTAEANNRIAADANLQTQITALSGGGGGGGTPSFQSGTDTIPFGTTEPGGGHHLTFPTPFATVCTGIVCQCNDAWWLYNSTFGPTFIATSITTTGCTIYAKPWDSTAGYIADIPYFWLATGH